RLRHVTASRRDGVAAACRRLRRRRRSLPLAGRRARTEPGSSHGMTVLAGVMTAAVVEGPRAAALACVPLPQPGDDEVLVRIEGCGVCASSLAVWEGRPWFDYPLAPGAPG